MGKLRNVVVQTMESTDTDVRRRRDHRDVGGRPGVPAGPCMGCISGRRQAAVGWHEGSDKSPDSEVIFAGSVPGPLERSTVSGRRWRSGER